MSPLISADPTVDFPVITESRSQWLIRTKRAVPKFLQGVFPFAGRGVFDIAPVNDAVRYVVPSQRTLEIIYFRAGNLSDDLVYFALCANDIPVRYFPIGPKSDLHVPLAIVESWASGTRIDICMAAPRGLTGTVVIDVGLVELLPTE